MRLCRRSKNLGKGLKEASTRTKMLRLLVESSNYRRKRIKELGKCEKKREAEYRRKRRKWQKRLKEEGMR
jgi:hypothetical protein